MNTSDNDKAEVSRQRRAEGASSAEIREARRRLVRAGLQQPNAFVADHLPVPLGTHRRP